MLVLYAVFEGSCQNQQVQGRHAAGYSLDKTWCEFKSGFGVAQTGYYWMSNGLLHELTQNNGYRAVFDLQSAASGSEYWATYDTFTVGAEASGYQLTIGSVVGINTANDAMSTQNGMRFTTRDRDNDNNSGGNCAQTNGGGYWYNACGDANINGDTNHVYWNYLSCFTAGICPYCATYCSDYNVNWSNLRLQCR